MGSITSVGAVPRRLTPIFRDRDELPASGDLGTELRAALRDSLFLVVICSPASAQSHWVAEEIIAFKRIHGENRVLALIVDGEPYDSNKPNGGALECFPAPLRYRLAEDGSLSTTPSEPIAADFRDDKDGRRLAKLKLVAGLTGVRLDDLAQRENQRRVRRLATLTAASMTGMVFAGGLALYANARRIEAVEQRKIAERETETARATSDFMVGIFELTNPATENPRTVSALTILSRGAERAHTELANQPVVQSRLLETLGKAYNNLGLLREAQKELEGGMPEIVKAGPPGAGALLQLANTYLSQGNLDKALSMTKRAQKLLGPDPAAYPELRGRAYQDIARIMTAKADPKAGLKALDMALKIYRETPEISPRVLAIALNTKGLLLSEDGDVAGADAALQESLQIFRSRLGESHLLTGQAWYALATNDFAAGKLAAADAAVANAIAIEQRVLDANNPILADSFVVQGQILQSEHKLDAAAKALNAAIATYNGAFQKPNWQAGAARVYLALVESDRNHYAAAMSALDKAKHDYDIGYGKLHPNHGDLLVNRASIEAKFHHRDEAISDCGLGIEILNKTMGADAAFTKADAQICAKL